MHAKQRNTRDQRIVELRSRGLTLEAIAQQFGVTKERVRQITNGYDVLRRFTTVPELMARFGATEYEVVNALEAAGLHKPRRRRNIIADTEVARVVNHLNARMAKECIVCGQSFKVPTRSRKRLCSPACFAEHRRRVRKSPRGPMSETTRRIHELLSAEPPGSVWVGFKEAVRLSGMTKMQLVWLRWRGLIACVPSGKHTRFGPIMLYSARHCELLQEHAETAS
jgi:transcriptional regulator with XRE-family HTH domain